MTTSSPWLQTVAAATALGITPRRLRDLRKQGLFKPRLHYRIASAPGKSRPVYLWHLIRCGEALGQPMEERENFFKLSQEGKGDRSDSSVNQTLSDDEYL